MRFRQGQTLRCYLTHVTDPRVLSIQQIAVVSARRWAIALAIKTVNRERGVHLRWSANPAVIGHQVWAVLRIAQIVQALRVEIAGRAGVDPLEGSLPLLIRYLPHYSAQGHDPIAAFVVDGRRLGFIRPVRRVVITAPVVDPPHLALPPPDLPRTRRTPLWLASMEGTEETCEIVGADATG